MKINKLKAAEQLAAREALSLNSGSGIVAMCTGGGKTKIAIDEVYDLWNSSTVPVSIMWVVPFEKLRDKTVEAEFTKWSPKNYTGKQDLDIICYASMKNVSGKHFQLVVLDEGHHMTEEREKFFHRNKADRIIVLTATPPHEPEKKDIFKRLGLKVVYELSLDDGVEKGVVAPYSIVQHNVPMYTKTETITISTGDKVETLNEETAYKRMSDKIRRIQMSGRSVPKFLYIQRAQLIYNFASKTHYAEKLIKELRSTNNRRLVFCGSIKQAEYLCPHTYHSKTNDKDFESFSSMKINELGVVNAVNEGQNFEGLDEAVVVQINSNPRHIIQRIGRLVRYRPGHRAEIHVLVSKNTKDEDWARKALEGINSENISYREIV